MEAMASALGAPTPLAIPRPLLRLAPYARVMMTSTLRVSNAKAREELGLEPLYPTCRQGVAKVAAALRADGGVEGSWPDSRRHSVNEHRQEE